MNDHDTSARSVHRGGRKSFATFAVILLLVSSRLVACGGHSTTSASTSSVPGDPVQEACAHVPANAQAKTPDDLVVVAVDDTGSSGSSARRAEQLDAVAAAATYAMLRHAALSLILFGSASSTTTSTCLSATPMVGLGSNPDNVKASEAKLPSAVRAVAEASLAKADAAAAQVGSATPGPVHGSDPTAALMAAKAEVTRFRKPATILVISDGMANTGCASLTAETGHTPSTVGSDQLAQARQRCGGVLPDLRGSSVVWSGIGRTNDGTAGELSSGLVDYWTALLATTGATVSQVTDAALPAFPADGQGQ